MGTQPRSTQMTLLISVHNIRWVLVPLTHCSKDGHKKASSPWGLYSLVPSLFEGTQHKFGHLIFWKDHQNLVHSGYYCRCAIDCGLSPIKWIFPTAAALFLTQWSVTKMLPPWLLLVTDSVQYPLVPHLWTNFYQCSPDTKKWFDVMPSTGQYSPKNRETQQKDRCFKLGWFSVLVLLHCFHDYVVE